MLDPRRLLIFEEVVRAGSFSAAASRLHLSQPSVSRHVAALERQSGLHLLKRTSTGLVVTLAGETVLRSAQSVRHELVALDAAVAAYTGNETGKVDVAAFPTAAATLVAPAMAALKQAHPGITSTLHEAARAQAIAMLRDGKIDVAVVFDTATDNLEDARGLAAVELMTERFVVAFAADHPLAHRKTIGLRALKREPWIVGTSSGPGPIEAACLAAGFTPRVAARADDQPTIQALVAGGIGVTLIPQRVAAGDVHPQISLCQLSPPLKRRIRVLTLDVRPRSHAVLAFLDAMQASADPTHLEATS